MDKKASNLVEQIEVYSMKNFLKIPNYSNYKHNDNNFRQNNSLSISSKNCKPGKVKAASDTLLKRIHKHRALYIFMLPAIIYVAIFYYGPMYGIQIAFKDYNSAFGIWNSKWVGFKHFKDFFGGYYFGRLIKNTFAISFYSLIDFPIQIIVALMLNEIRNYKYKKFVQTVLYAPHFISTVVMVGIVTTMLSPSIGVVNHIIELLGYERQYFIIQPAAFRHIYVWSGVWQEMGWGAIIYLAALSNVDIQLHEAATIDGSSEIGILLRIFLPLSTPVLAVMVLFYAVAHWNSFFSALMYINDQDKYPLQIHLRKILIQYEQNHNILQDVNQGRDVVAQAVRYATIIVSTVPILMVYPFLQKYFVKGVMVGAIKG